MPVEYPINGAKPVTHLTIPFQNVPAANKKAGKLSKAHFQSLNPLSHSYYYSVESTSRLTSDEVSKLLFDFLMSLPGASTRGLGYL